MSSLAVLSFACSRSRTRRRGVRFLLAARCLPRRQALDGRPWLPLGQWQLRCFLDGHMPAWSQVGGVAVLCSCQMTSRRCEQWQVCLLQDFLFLTFFFSFIFDFFFYFFPLRRPATHEFNSRIRRRPPPPVFSSASQRPRAGGGFGAGSAHQANQALQASIGTSSTACASVAVVDCTLQSPLSCWSFWSCWSCESPFLSLSCALRTLSRDLHHHSAERCMLQWSVFA